MPHCTAYVLYEFGLCQPLGLWTNYNLFSQMISGWVGNRC